MRVARPSIATSSRLSPTATMNSIRVKCFLVLLMLSAIGFGPLSLTALIGMYVVWRRPHWFEHVVQGVYRNRPVVSAENPTLVAPIDGSALGTRIRCFLALAILLALDIAPIPVVGAIGMYVLIRRPIWFLDLVSRIYGRRVS